MLYVDNLRKNGMMYYNGISKQNVKTAHLFADSLQELFDIGDLLGLKPRWLHRPLNKVPHFDVMPGKYKLLLKQKEFSIILLDRKNYICIYKMLLENFKTKEKK